jgi:cell division protein ZapA
MSETSKKSSVTVRIAGEEHLLRSSADPDYTRACARFVDEGVQEVRKMSGMVESHKAVILAALSIADQYFRTRDELDRLRKEVASRSMNLVRRIEDELEAGKETAG